mmetsp:Transcript_94228/g.281198  ORF Transcript_94228/g.281198 Transcript_94228/m.281198 type:complete len:139 (-) Transcript_94228:81-497(-)
MAGGARVPQSVQFAASISGVHTDFVITDFGSELMFVITQSCKIGSFIEASATEPQESVGTGEKVYDVRVLMGDRRAEHYRTYARALIEIVAARSGKSVLLGIALKEHSVDGFRQVIREIRERVAPMTAAPDEEDDMVP